MSPVDQPILYAALVFVAMTLLDFVYAEYTKAAADRAALKASMWAAGILPFNFVVVTGYIEVWWMVIPACAGAWLGTKLSIKYGDAVHECLAATWKQPDR